MRIGNRDGRNTVRFGQVQFLAEPGVFQPQPAASLFESALLIAFRLRNGLAPFGGQTGRHGHLGRPPCVQAVDGERLARDDDIEHGTPQRLLHGGRSNGKSPRHGQKSRGRQESGSS